MVFSQRHHSYTGKQSSGGGTAACSHHGASRHHMMTAAVMISSPLPVLVTAMIRGSSRRHVASAASVASASARPAPDCAAFVGSPGTAPACGESVVPFRPRALMSRLREWPA